MSFNLRHFMGITLIIALCVPSIAVAAGGTSTIATKGQKIPAKESWPSGVAQLLNHETRGTGWNDWFSEWPNDVDHFEFQVQSMDQVNDVVREFAKIQVDRNRAKVDGRLLGQRPVPPEIRLCPNAAPQGFGWVSKFPQDRKIPMIFAMGDQARLDQWYESFIKPREGKFGVMQFEEVPVAVPPTLTLFVGEPVFDLEKLEIPNGIRVVEGCLPGRWHSAKITLPTRKSPQGEAERQPVPMERLTPEQKQRQAWEEAVQHFLQQREEEAENDQR